MFEVSTAPVKTAFLTLCAYSPDLCALLQRQLLLINQATGPKATWDLNVCMHTEACGSKSPSCMSRQSLLMNLNSYFSEFV